MPSSSRPLSLLFGVHAHQPVGNFIEVVEDAHRRCYKPFFEVLEQYPGFRFSMHSSGWLLEMLEARFPEDMERLAAMTRRGQVEWFGSGDYEPVLASIPHRDRLAQIAALADRLERRYGVRPEGAWLTERVWESGVVPSLAQAGIRYVPIDDYHFLAAGEKAARMDGYFRTEEGGEVVDVFPILEEARYRLPFSPAAEAVAWLEGLAREGRRAVCYFDDIEKFGVWPETYSWVYERGWLRQFIEGVLGSKLLATESFGGFHARERPRGVVYLPSLSYREMSEWSLPAEAGLAFEELSSWVREAGRAEQAKPFLRGGIWRNFLSRYPEANWMHKRMLGLSARVAELPPGPAKDEATVLLHRSQSNDAYWHGLFGGLYLPHLRRAVWKELVRLDAVLERESPSVKDQRTDLDLEGTDERLLRGPAGLAVVREDGDAAVIEFSSHRLGHNFGDTLRRRPEPYHALVGKEASASAAHGGIASAHDRVAFLHDIGPADVTPDPRPRALFVDSWDGAAVSSYRIEGSGYRSGSLHKRYSFNEEALVAAYQSAGAGTLSVQLNLAMPSCDGFGGRYVLEDGSIPGGFGQPLEAAALRALRLEDSELQGALVVRASAPVRVTGRPAHTVSRSEAGLERIMQAVELNLEWTVPAGGGRLEVLLEVHAAARG